MYKIQKASEKIVSLNIYEFHESLLISHAIHTHTRTPQKEWPMYFTVPATSYQLQASSYLIADSE